jgi:hypothetical protein
VLPVKYELGSYIPEEDIPHSHRSENLKQENVTLFYKTYDIYNYIIAFKTCAIYVQFIVISESRRLHISSLSSPSLMKRDFKTTATSKRPEF